MKRTVNHSSPKVMKQTILNYILMFKDMNALLDHLYTERKVFFQCVCKSYISKLCVIFKSLTQKLVDRLKGLITDCLSLVNNVIQRTPDKSTYLHRIKAPIYTELHIKMKNENLIPELIIVSFYLHCNPVL